MSAISIGDRVQLSYEAKIRMRAHFKYHRLVGTVATMPKTGFVGVIWDGNKTPSSYHPDFLEKVNP